MILQQEITNDPLGRGYAGMTDAQVAADLNTVYRTRNRATMMASEVFNAVNVTEFNALAEVNKALIWNVLHLGELNPFGVEATIFTSVFGAGSTTIANLANLRKEAISRATELGLGYVKVGHVQEARNG